MSQLTHWMPERWRESLAHLRDDIHNAVERWFPGRHGSTPSNGSVPVEYVGREPVESLRSPSSIFASSLAIDVDETDDAVQVTADVPGLDPKDFTVEISGQRLVIRGEKKHESHRSERGYRYSERSYGAFARVLPLPCEVVSDQAQAKYTQGVLRITLPKTEQAKAKRVRIRVQEEF